MNDHELRTRLSQLGVGIALDETKDGIILSGAGHTELSTDLHKALESAEDHLVRRELHLTAWVYVSARLATNDGPGLHRAAVTAFGDGGRYERLCQSWSMGSLDDFNETLRACMDAAIQAPHSPIPSQRDVQRVEASSQQEQQLSFGH